MSYSLRQEIADQVYQAEGWHTTPDAKHIKEVAFRPGMAQIDVKYFDTMYDVDGDEIDNPKYWTECTIDALPVFSAILQRMIDEEK